MVYVLRPALSSGAAKDVTYCHRQSSLIQLPLDSYPELGLDKNSGIEFADFECIIRRGTLRISAASFSPTGSRSPNN